MAGEGVLRQEDRRENPKKAKKRRGRRTRAKNWRYLQNGWGDWGNQGGVRKPSPRGTWP